MKKLFILLFVLLLIPSVHATLSICSAGCNYTDLPTALSAINGTNETLVFNESGTYVMPTIDYYVNDSSNGLLSSADGVIALAADNIIFDCNGSSFTGNNPDKGLNAGAAIVVNDYDNITITGCTLKNYTYAVYMTLSNYSNLNNLTIEHSRYAITDLAGSKASISDSTFYANRYGLDLIGTGSSYDATTNITISAVNVSSSSRDGIRVIYAYAKIYNTYVSESAAGYSNIFTTDAQVQISDSILANNANEGLYLYDSSIAFVSNITLLNQSYGLVTEDSVLYVSDSNFDNSTYAVHDYHGGTIVLERCSFMNVSTELTLNEDDVLASTAEFVNMTYNNSKVVFGDTQSALYNQFYLKTQVVDASSNVSFANVTLNNSQGTELFTRLTNLSGIIIPELQLINLTIQNSSGITSYSNFTFNTYKSGYLRSLVSSNISNNIWINITLQNQTGIMPTYTLFTLNTTDFTFQSDLNAVSNATIGNIHGVVLFPGSQNFSGADLDSGIVVDDGLLGLNSSELPTLNVSARITMYNMTCPLSTIYYYPTFTNSKTAALSGGQNCSSAGVCSDIVCSQSTLSFNVTGFSTFAVADPAMLAVSAQTDLVNRYANQTVWFKANYSNSSTPINGTDVYCEISFNHTGSWSTPTNMTYSLTDSAFRYLTSFDSNYSASYNISCNGLAGGFEPLNDLGFFTLLLDTDAPIITIVNPTNDSTLPIGSSQTYLNISTSENATCKYSTSSGFDFSSTGTLMNSSDTLKHVSSSIALSPGNYTYYYKCNDSFNNYNSIAVEHRFVVDVDSTAPNVTFLSPTPDDGLTLSSSSRDFRVSVNEAANATLYFDGVVYPLLNSSGGTIGTTLNKTLSNMTDGSHTYYIRAWDLEGNSAITSTRSVNVDTTGPVITFVSPTNLSTKSDRINVLLSITTNEASTCVVTANKLGATTSSTQVTLAASTSANTSFTKYFNSSANSNGYNNYFTVRCTDRLSFQSTKTNYFKINDTTAPTITFAAPTPKSGGYSTSDDVTINLTSSEALGSVKKVRVDGGLYYTLLGSSYYYYSFSNLNESEHTVDVNISDTVGNIKVTSRSFTVDTTNPEIKVEEPSDGGTLRSCYDILFNVTLEEESDCEFEWFIDEQESCNNDCDDDYNDCYDSADDSDERNQCKDEKDECYDDCVDDRYTDFEEDSLEEEDRDVCDDCMHLCVDECDKDHDSCMDKADTGDEEDKCDEKLDRCENRNCPRDCDTECLWAYSLVWDECVDDADYIVSFTCEDEAGNTNMTNVSFKVSDNTAPVITALTKSDTIYSNSVTLFVTTSEPGSCKYSSSKTSFDQMENVMSGSSLYHSKVVEFSSPGVYSYNFACNDSRGNKMTGYNSTSLNVLFTNNPYSQKRVSLSSGSSTKINFDTTDVPVSTLELKVTEAVTDELVEIEVLPTKPTAVSTPPNKIYKYLDIRKSKIASSSVEEVKITFNVEKSWLTNNGYTADDIVLLHYVSGWDELSTTKVSEDSEKVSFEATTDSLSYFAVSVKSKSVDKTDSTTLPNNSIIAASPEDEGILADEESPSDIESKSSWWLWVLIIAVLFVAAGSVAIMVPKKKHTTVKEAKVEPVVETVTESVELTENEQLIVSSLEDGVSLEDIKSIFLNNGWTSDDFDKAYNVLISKLPPEEAAADIQSTETVVEQNELTSFISDMIHQGMSKDEIITLLVSNGWPHDEVQNSVEGLYTESRSVHREEYPAGQGEVEPSPDLGRYIFESIQAGKSTHEITQELIAEGWPEATIMQELKVLEHQKENIVQLKEYVKSQMASGVSPDELIKILKSEGWTDNEIEQAF